MSRFALYEEYGANYELVQRDVDGTQRNTPAWADFNKAIEALSEHINPVNSREANRKKAMTIKDLLIKVSQRCVYVMRNQSLTGHPRISLSSDYLDTSSCSATFAN